MSYVTTWLNLVSLAKRYDRALVEEVLYYHVGVGGGYKRLVVLQVRGECLAAGTVKLTKHIIKQQQGLLVPHFFQQPCFKHL